MIKGQVDYHGLTDWWLTTFTAEEREHIEQVYKPMGYEAGDRPLTQGAIAWTTGKPSQLLWGLASWFNKPGDRHITRRVLAKAEELAKAKLDWINLHYTYQQMIEVNYKDRDVDPAALEMAIGACVRQIEIAPQAIKAFEAQARALEKHANSSLPRRAYSLPTHVGFYQLAIIREKWKDYGEVIRLCNLAKEQGWAGDWDKRIERCEKKLRR